MSVVHLGDTFLVLLPETLLKIHRRSWITTIEEVKDIDQIPLTGLVRNLQTYEIRLGSIGKGGKSKNLALKGIKKEIEDSEDEDEDDDECKVEFNQPSCSLYFVPNLLVL